MSPGFHFGGFLPPSSGSHRTGNDNGLSNPAADEGPAAAGHRQSEQCEYEARLLTLACLPAVWQTRQGNYPKSCQLTILLYFERHYLRFRLAPTSQTTANDEETPSSFDSLQPNVSLAEALPWLDINSALTGLCSMLAASLALTPIRVYNI